VIKYKYIFQIKYTEAILLSNSTRKLLWLQISKMPIAVLKNKFIVSFIITFGTFLFPIEDSSLRRGAQSKNVEIQIEKKQGGVKQITVITHYYLQS